MEVLLPSIGIEIETLIYSHVFIMYILNTVYVIYEVIHLHTAERRKIDLRKFRSLTVEVLSFQV